MQRRWIGRNSRWDAAAEILGVTDILPTSRENRKQGAMLNASGATMHGSNSTRSEPWLRGTLTEVPAVLRAVLHALELAREDTDRCCAQLTDTELHARPFGLAPVSFHLRHIARSIDRLLTYVEGHRLSGEQLAVLNSEMDVVSTRDELLAELHRALAGAESRIRALDTSILEDVRKVGRLQLPSTVAGLLVHIADHTQRHVGQAVTTSKIVLAQRLVR
jgi:hypothetical protein